MKMKISVSFEFETPEGVTKLVQQEEIISLERGDFQLETLGLSLTEAKEVLAKLQEGLVKQQVDQYLATQKSCPACGVAYFQKGQHQIVFRTLYGNLKLPSPRYYSCPCQLSPQAQTQLPELKPKKSSFSPLAAFLKERSAPELVYLETKWAALMSYGLTGRLLEDVLPLEGPVSKATLSQHVKEVAEKIEGELGEEQFSFIEGCPEEWQKLPQPDLPLIIGIDGGYIHACNSKGAPKLHQTEVAQTTEGHNAAYFEQAEEEGPQKEEEEKPANWFEMIVGKSMPTGEGGKGKGKEKIKCFGFVNCYDKKPKRRLFEVLKGQGMQNNQPVTFLSDGGDSVRNLQLYLNPEAEHLLDWFHITMRLTVMRQSAKGLPVQSQAKTEKELKEQLEDEDWEAPQLNSAKVEKNLESAKWQLWHGNVFMALQEIKDLVIYLEGYADTDGATKKLLKKVSEFHNYIQANQNFIVNYGERYRHGEIISTAFVESTVNQLISRRFVKKQQMRWKKPGAHLLMQIRTKVLNNELRETFQRWYPGMKEVLDETEALVAEEEDAAA